MRLSAERTNDGRLFQTVGAQHENRREAMFIDEDVLTVDRTQMTSEHATVCVVTVEKKDTTVVVV